MKYQGKGLISLFDFIKFCKVNKCLPVIKDVWGLLHNLIKLDIRVIFTLSQHKLWKYYDSWELYKRLFKLNNCLACRTNFLEDWIPDTDINYQMLQTLQLTDDEITTFTLKAHTRILNISSDKQSMLRTLSANKDSNNPYERALAYYELLLRDGYSRESLKSIKKRMTLDAKSGAIRCKNKRLFAIPDFYAACQYWFLHQLHPIGLLYGDEISAKPFRGRGVSVKRLSLINAHMDPGLSKEEDVLVADVLRSPHLSMLHMICPIVDRPEVYEWFTTNGIYTSCHSLITRRLALDVDGDQLNVVTDKTIVNAALRNLALFNVYTLYYEMGKAAPLEINYQHMYHGLSRAHQYSGIGQVSNSLTKLWNRELITQDARDAADWISMYNNFVIKHLSLCTVMYI